MRDAYPPCKCTIAASAQAEERGFLKLELTPSIPGHYFQRAEPVHHVLVKPRFEGDAYSGEHSLPLDVNVLIARSPGHSLEKALAEMALEVVDWAVLQVTRD
jgi:hypothetical protein